MQRAMTVLISAERNRRKGRCILDRLLRERAWYHSHGFFSEPGKTTNSTGHVQCSRTAADQQVYFSSDAECGRSTDDHAPIVAASPLDVLMKIFRAAGAFLLQATAHEFARFTGAFRAR
jgi:hypothetical protein